MATSRAHRPGARWFTFAGLMFALAGVSNLLWGIGALDKKDYLPKHGLIASNLSFWGWMSLIWAAMALTAAVLLFTRNPWSAGVGMVLGALNAVFWFFVLPVLPIWSMVMIAIDVLIIWQLAAHSEVVDT